MKTFSFESAYSIFKPLDILVVIDIKVMLVNFSLYFSMAVIAN